MGKRWLLERVRYGVLSPLIFTNNRIVRSFGQPWLRKARDIVEGRIGNVN